MDKIPRAIVDLLARDFVRLDGIYASKCAVTNLCGIALISSVVLVLILIVILVLILVAVLIVLVLIVILIVLVLIVVLVLILVVVHYNSLCGKN